MSSLQESLDLTRGSLLGVRELIFMIEETERRYANRWPTLSRTVAGAHLLESTRPMLDLCVRDHLEALRRLEAGEALEGASELARVTETLIHTVRRLLAHAVRELEGEWSP